MSNKIGVLTTTRNRYKELENTLLSIINDADFEIDIFVVDDSSNKNYKEKNKEIIKKLSKENNINYYSTKEYFAILEKIPHSMKPFFLEVTKPLGASYYDSVGPRNLGLLLLNKKDYIFIIDDDVLVKHKFTKSKNSTLSTMINQLKEYDICGVSWKGIPDQSTLEHLDDEISVQELPELGLPPTYKFPNRKPIRTKERGWRRKKLPYVTSGGGMVFKKELLDVFFPKIFNDDYHWISYNYFVKGKKTVVVEDHYFLNKPPQWRYPESKTLIRESIGEIIFEAIHQYSYNNNKPGWLYPSEVDFVKVKEQYMNYLSNVLHSLDKIKEKKPLAESPIKNYNKIIPEIKKTLEYLSEIDGSFFRNKIINYTSSIYKWKELLEIFRNEVNL